MGTEGIMLSEKQCRILLIGDNEDLLDILATLVGRVASHESGAKWPRSS
jgi:hypothetical protein